jgi:hypothetical protein
MDMVDTLAALLDALLLDDTADKEALRVMQAVLDTCHELGRVESQAGSTNSNFSINVDLPLTAQKGDAKTSVETESYTADADIFNATAESFAEKATESQSVTARAKHEQFAEKSASQLCIREETAQDLLRLSSSSAITNNQLQSQVQEVKNQLQTIAQLHTKLTALADDFGRLMGGDDVIDSSLFGLPVGTASA